MPTPHTRPPRRARALRTPAALTAVALSAALLTPTPAMADERRPLMPDESVSINPDVRPGAIDASAASGKIAYKVKGWSKAKQVVYTKYAFQSYDVDRNAKGQGVVAWSESRGNGVRIWYARLSPKNKITVRKRLTGWIKESTGGGISGQVGASIDKRGNAVVAWTAVTGGRTGAQAAKIGRKGKVTKRWLTKSGAAPAQIKVHGSPNGHTVVWWNGMDPDRWGHPRHFVNHQGTSTWKAVPYEFENGWMPDEGGTASISTSGLMTATWVERGPSTGRLRALTYDRKGRTTNTFPATTTALIQNSAHTTTPSGDLTVTFMNLRGADGWRTDWYSVRRIKGTWRARTTVPKKNEFGYSWTVAGNNSGKAVMLGLGYASGAQPAWTNLIGGVQKKHGKKWKMANITPRIQNSMSFFTPIAHMTKNGRSLATFTGKASNGIAWTKKGKDGKWTRSQVSNDGDIKLASDRKNRVTMLVPSSRKGWRLVFYTKKL